MVEEKNPKLEIVSPGCEQKIKIFSVLRTSEREFGETHFSF